MQGKHLYEYAVIRLVPRVEREEFINIGVILYCPGKKFLQARTHIDCERTRAFGVGTDFVELNRYLTSLKLICAGGEASGPIGRLPVASRFRWLTSARSTILQPSKVHSGFCEQPEDSLARLFEELVS